MTKIIFGLYCLFLIFFLVFSYAFIDPNFIYLKNFYTGFALSNRFLTTIIYIGLIFVFFLFYIFFLRQVSKSKLAVSNIKIIIAAAISILLFSYPAMLSYDIFNYTSTARVAFFYHENPYIIMPIAFNNDTMLLFTRAANKTALYGPFWILLTAIPYYIGSAFNFLFTLLSFKLFIISFYVGTGLLIFKIRRNLTSLCLFSLNPLVLIEALVGSHNDIVMMFLSLFSLYLLSKNKLVLAAIFLILSILIKYATLFLVPVFLYVLFKKIKKEDVNWSKLFYFSLLSMLVVFLLSPLREEIYPWYALWFLPFVSLVPHNKLLFYVSIAASFGLMLSYVPFMLSGTYSGITPLIKLIVMFLPLSFVPVYLLKTKLWPKISYR